MARPKATKLNLSKLEQYLKARHSEADECYQAADRVRQELGQAFEQEMAAWQERFDLCYQELARQRRDLPTPFVEHIDQVEQEERQSLREEIARLEQESTQDAERSDALLAAAQQEALALRRANPDIDEREEELKALVVRCQDEYAEAYEEAERLASQPAGWLTNFLALQRLRSQQRAAKRKQEQAMAQLRVVRQEWLERVQKAGETQGQLRQEWQGLRVKVAEAQTRRAHLSEHLDELAEQNALQRVLVELTEPPAVDGEFGEALKDMAHRNIVRAQYEEALEVLAEFLGRTKGMADGLDKFGSSVANVLEEQRRYGLRQVHVQIPPAVDEVLSVWAEVQPRLAEADRLATNPTEVTAILRRCNEERLTDAQISEVFETLGEELSRATAAWS